MLLKFEAAILLQSSFLGNASRFPVLRLREVLDIYLET